MPENRAFLEARTLMFRALELPPEVRKDYVKRSASSTEVSSLVLELLEQEGGGTEHVENPSLATALSSNILVPGYQILGVLGSGGMGTVYHAEQDDTGLEVAIKVLHTGLGPSHQRRFELECKALESLDHPHIARFLQSGWVQVGEQMLPYFAMELIDGTDLRSYIRAEDPSRETLVQIIVTLADALHHAHGRGIVHRDLKPENILVDRRGQPRIVDFGIAHITDFDKSVTTIHSDVGQIIGTLQYMSPEQVTAGADHPGPVSDIYSLGVVAYEALAGTLPYDLRQHSIPETVALIHTANAPRIGKTLAGFPAALDRILQGMLQKDPRERYADAGKVRDDWARFLRRERIKGGGGGGGVRRYRVPWPAGDLLEFSRFCW